MSQETEKVLKKLTEILQNEDFESEEEMDAFLQNLVESDGFPGLDGPEEGTAEYYLELAENAVTPQEVLSYARKAAKADPDDLDAQGLVAMLGARTPLSAKKRLEEVIKKGDALMEEGGYFAEDTGDFWLVLETRPYMRLLHDYMMTLIDLAMYPLAIPVGLRMLQLCENDNLGVRFPLAALYATQGDLESLEALWESFGKSESCQFLLPLAVCNYSYGDLKSAKKYIKSMAKNYGKDWQLFLEEMLFEEAESVMNSDALPAYAPFSFDELCISVRELPTSYFTYMPFFEWAYHEIGQ